MSRGEHFKQYPQEMRDRVVRAYLDGMPSRQIKSEFQISDNTIIRWVRQAGYRTRREKREKITDILARHGYDQFSIRIKGDKALITFEIERDLL